MSCHRCGARGIHACTGSPIVWTEDDKRRLDAALAKCFGWKPNHHPIGAAMSWSVMAVGKPAAVKAKLAEAFASAKTSTANIPHECESVSLVEQIVNGQLDFLAGLTKGQPAVQVTANGSAYSTTDAAGLVQGGSQVTLDVKPLFGFVE